MRKTSAATMLRAVRRNLAETKGALELCRMRAEEYRARATRAEQEVTEWKERFDALLTRGPQSDGR